MVPWGLTLGAGAFQAIAICLACHGVRARRSGDQTDSRVERPELSGVAVRGAGFSGAELPVRMSEDSFEDLKLEFSVQELDGKMTVRDATFDLPDYLLENVPEFRQYGALHNIRFLTHGLPGDDCHHCIQTFGCNEYPTLMASVPIAIPGSAHCARPLVTAD